MYKVRDYYEYVYIWETKGTWCEREELESGLSFGYLEDMFFEDDLDFIIVIFKLYFVLGGTVIVFLVHSLNEWSFWVGEEGGTTLTLLGGGWTMMAL